MKGFIGDLFSVGFSKILVIAFGLGYSIVTARYLGPELNGTIAALMVYPSLFMTIGSLGIRQSTAFYVGKGIYSDLKIKKAVIQLWYISSIICVVTSYFLMKYFSNSGNDDFLLLLAITPIPFTLFITYNSGFFLGKNEIKKFNKVNWVPSLVKLISVVLLVIIIPYSIYGAMVAGVIAPLIMSLILLKGNSFWEGFSLGFEFNTLKDLFSLGIVYAIALLVINLNYKLDVIILDKISTEYQTGIYSKGSQIIEYLWQIPMMLSTIVFARSATSKNSKEFSYKVVKLLRISLIIVGVACLFMVVVSNVIIDILFGNEFKESSVVLVYLLPGVLLLTIFKVLNMDLAGRGKPWLSMHAMIPALIVNIILNLLLIPKNGANGAAIASTISYCVAALIFVVIYSKEVKISIVEIFRFSKKDINPIVNFLQKRNKKYESV